MCENYTYLGTVEAVREDGLVRIEQKNKFSVGETVEIMKPDGRNLEKEVAAICDEEGNPVRERTPPKTSSLCGFGGGCRVRRYYPQK